MRFSLLEKILLGGSLPSGIAAASRLSNIKKHEKQKDLEQQNILKKISSGVGREGFIETRPTADIAARIQMLKETSPKIESRYPELYRQIQQIQDSYDQERIDLQKELEIRKVAKEEFEKNSLNSKQSLRDRELEERIKRIK